jgi:ribosomal protein RSM22 (predicted rRNA methylase)
MVFPQRLKDAIADEIAHAGASHLVDATEELSKRYRDPSRFDGSSPKKKRFMTSAAHRSAYLVTRMPATYAAVYHVMREIQARMPQINLYTLLDLGAGPGTVMWAMAEIFPSLQKVVLVEQDAELMAIGRRLAKNAGCSAIRTATWQASDLREFGAGSYDLVTLSYALGELSEQSLPTLIKKCWQAADKAMVIIEPGTMPGFARIRAARQELIALGGHVVAPCPHSNTCPMPENDWCHFAERLERSRQHRQAKEGTLTYEDEKFSYVVVVKSPVKECSARVLRHPLKRPGHVCLSLCTEDGLQQVTVSKKQKELYQIARKTEWGDAYERGDKEE